MSSEPIRLYPGSAPGSESWTHAERQFHSAVWDTDVVTNVVVPTITPVLPEGEIRPGRPAVVVAPGGAFVALSIESEGFQAARWLADRGIVAFVLQYRLVPTGGDATMEVLQYKPEDYFAAVAAVAPLAAADGMAAMHTVRARATEFGVDPQRVGFVGFSAGGAVALQVAYGADVDARPNFVAPIYAPVRNLDLSAVPAGSGPMFITAATDDGLGFADDAVQLYNAWRGARLPVELHLYERGGHGFGMRTQHLPSDSWIDRFGEWLGTHGIGDAAD